MQSGTNYFSSRGGASEFYYLAGRETDYTLSCSRGCNQPNVVNSGTISKMIIPLFLSKSIHPLVYEDKII
jgi:hypothetical protein